MEKGQLGVSSFKRRCMLRTNGVHEYHDINAIMNPNVEKKKVRPYKSNGFNTGTDCALWFTGLTHGARHKTEIPIVTPKKTFTTQMG